MTTAMIEFTIYKIETKTAKTLRPFAWFGWPLEAFWAARAALWKGMIYVSTGRQIIRQSTLDYAPATPYSKEIIVRKDGKRESVREASMLKPMLINTRYESEADFKKDSAF